MASLLMIALVAWGCREQPAPPRYPEDLGTDLGMGKVRLLPTGSTAHDREILQGRGTIIEYDRSAYAEDDRGPDAIEEPGVEIEPASEPEIAVEAGASQPAPPEVESAIRELVNNLASAELDGLPQHIVREQRPVLEAIMGPAGEVLAVLGELEAFEATAPKTAALAKTTAGIIKAQTGGLPTQITEAMGPIRMLGTKWATTEIAGKQITFELVGDTWLFRIPDLPGEDVSTDFANALRDLADELDAVAEGLDLQELGDDDAVTRIQTASQSFAAQISTLLSKPQ
ncbi:MAG: hypothetical protein JSV19_13505 [Phycisphaerales bacterium]|nr:MAG: hypothetical protein JSV19_13505 [Phycisphaerales bacterium]